MADKAAKAAAAAPADGKKPLGQKRARLPEEGAAAAKKAAAAATAAPAPAAKEATPSARSIEIQTSTETKNEGVQTGENEQAALEKVAREAEAQRINLSIPKQIGNPQLPPLLRIGTSSNSEIIQLFSGRFSPDQEGQNVIGSRAGVNELLPNYGIDYTTEEGQKKIELMQKVFGVRWPTKDPPIFNLIVKGCKFAGIETVIEILQKRIETLGEFVSKQNGVKRINIEKNKHLQGELEDLKGRLEGLEKTDKLCDISGSMIQPTKSTVSPQNVGCCDISLLRDLLYIILLLQGVASDKVKKQINSIPIKNFASLSKKNTQEIIEKLRALQNSSENSAVSINAASQTSNKEIKFLNKLLGILKAREELTEPIGILSDDTRTADEKNKARKQISRILENILSGVAAVKQEAAASQTDLNSEGINGLTNKVAEAAATIKAAQDATKAVQEQISNIRNAAEAAAAAITAAKTEVEAQRDAALAKAASAEAAAAASEQKAVEAKAAAAAAAAALAVEKAAKEAADEQANEAKAAKEAANARAGSAEDAKEAANRSASEAAAARAAAEAARAAALAAQEEAERKSEADAAEAAAARADAAAKEAAARQAEEKAAGAEAAAREAAEKGAAAEAERAAATERAEASQAASLAATARAEAAEAALIEAQQAAKAAAAALKEAQNASAASAASQALRIGELESSLETTIGELNNYKNIVSKTQFLLGYLILASDEEKQKINSYFATGKAESKSICKPLSYLKVILDELNGEGAFTETVSSEAVENYRVTTSGQEKNTLRNIYRNALVKFFTEKNMNDINYLIQTNDDMDKKVKTVGLRFLNMFLIDLENFRIDECEKVEVVSPKVAPLVPNKDINQIISELITNKDKDIRNIGILLRSVIEGTRGTRLQGMKTAKDSGDKLFFFREILSTYMYNLFNNIFHKTDNVKYADPTPYLDYYRSIINQINPTANSYLKKIICTIPKNVIDKLYIVQAVEELNKITGKNELETPDCISQIPQTGGKRFTKTHKKSRVKKNGIRS
jgi:hypothetical protein